MEGGHLSPLGTDAVPMVIVHISFLGIPVFVPKNNFKREGELQGCSPAAGDPGG